MSEVYFQSTAPFIAMSSVTCHLYLALVWASVVMLPTTKGETTCKPLEVETEKGPIKVGCSTECQSAHIVRISHSGQVECVVMTPEEHKRMGTAHHLCRLGTCEDGTCKKGNLQIKCWRNCRRST
uniref:Evasin n=1 Tax=Amblyomma triste TaxID=251400 RepID=A0A023G6R4_AMBTT